MSFFPPIMYPNGSFTQHRAVHPPPHPCSGGIPCTALGQTQSPSSFSEPSRPHGNNQQEGSLPSYSLPALINPGECVPPHGPCPGPIPPSDEPYSCTHDHIQANSRDHARSIPISHSAQQGLPLPNHNFAEIPYSASASPPRYIPASPPGYKALPSPSEGTLLLAPPPSFLASTCPYLQSSEAPATNGLPTHVCPHCYSHGTHVQQGEQMDWVISLLIILNFFVWGAVAYGYWCEYNGMGNEGIEWGNWVASCVGSQGAAGWGRVCMGNDCKWAFVDC